MKIIIGSLSHESNSFNPKQMELSDFSPIYGGDVLDVLKAGGRSALHGIYEVLSSQGVEIIPTIFARATPGGIVSSNAYQTMKEGFLKQLRQVEDPTGVCLHLHGSMTVAGIGDAEGDLLTSVREIVGPDIPIVTSLDMHTTLTETMLLRANAFVGYRTAPHIDAKETGMQAANILMGALNEGYELKMAAVGLPILVSGEQSETAKPPMVYLIERLHEIDKIPGVLSSSILMGFPWVDTKHSRGAALVVTKADQELAESEAVKLAQAFWDRHQEFKFTTEGYPFAEALEVALGKEGRPVCIADCGDNPGAGGSQNIVQPLEHMLALNLENILFGAINDPKAYQICAERQIGDKVSLSLGRLSIEPEAAGLDLEVEIKKIGQLGKTPAAVVMANGIDVIIASKRVMMLDPKDLEQLGLEPKSYRLIVLKSGYLDPKYEAIAAYGLLALTRGYTNQNFNELDYKHIQRPMYPLDKDFTYNPAEYLLTK